MTLQKKIRLFTLTSFVLLITAIGVQNTAHGATSGVIVEYIPYLSFQNIPDSFILGSTSVPIADTSFMSDSGDTLPVSRHLTVVDNRDCGGFNLLLSASNFSVSPTLNNSFRVVTSTQDAISESVVSGVKYYTGFSGAQTVAAPLNVTTSEFNDIALFTDAPFDTTDNILNEPIDVLQAPLTAPNGRVGTMHVSMSFALTVPKLTIPGNNYTTLTFTLSDDTSGTCS